MATETVTIILREEGSSSITDVLANLQAQLKGLATGVDDGLGEVGDGAKKATTQVDRLTAATKNLSKTAAFKKAAAESSSYVAALKAAKTAQTQLTAKTKEAVTESGKLAAQTAKLQASASLKEAALGNSAYIESLQRARAAQQELAAAAKAPELAAKAAAEAAAEQERAAVRAAKEQEKAAEQVAKAQERATLQAEKAHERFSREAIKAAQRVAREQERLASRAMKARERAASQADKLAAQRVEAVEAEAQAQRDLLKSAQAALNAIGRGSEDAAKKSKVELEFLKQINDQLDEAEASKAFASQALQNKEFVKQLRAANIAQNKLDTATQSFGERVAVFLEGAENVEGLVGVITIGVDAVSAFWAAWKEGAAAADITATVENLGRGVSEIERLRQAGGGVQTQAQVGRNVLGGTLGGLTDTQIDQINELGARAAALQGTLEGVTGAALGELQTTITATLQEEIKAGNLGQIGQLLIGGEAQLNLALERLARETGATVETLTAEQRARLTLQALSEQSAQRVEVVNNRASAATARLESSVISFGQQLAAGLQGGDNVNTAVLGQAGLTAEQVLAAEQAGDGALRDLMQAQIQRLTAELVQANRDGAIEVGNAIKTQLSALGQSTTGAGDVQRVGARGVTGDTGIGAEAELIAAAQAEQARQAGNFITAQNEILNVQRQRGEAGARDLLAASEALRISEDEFGVATDVASLFGRQARAQAEATEARVEALAAALQISRAEAEALLTTTKRADQLALASRFEAESVVSLRQSVAQEQARINQRLELGDLLGAEERRQLELKKIEVDRQAVAASHALTVKEFDDALASERSQQLNALALDKLRLETELQRGVALSDGERATREAGLALVDLQQRALGATDTAEQYNQAILNSVTATAQATDPAQWATLLRSIGTNEAKIDEATASADAFGAALKQSLTFLTADDSTVLRLNQVTELLRVAGDQAIKIDEGVAAQRRKSSGERQKRAEDLSKFLEQLERKRVDSLLAQAGTLAEVRGALNQGALALASQFDDRLAASSLTTLGSIDQTAATALLQLERFQQESLARVGDSAEGQRAVERAVEAQLDAIESGLIERVTGPAFETGRAFVDSMAEGFATGGHLFAQGFNMLGVELEERAVRLGLTVQENLTRRLNEQLAGRGDLEADRGAAAEQFGLDQADAAGDSAAEFAVLQLREAQLAEFRQRELELVIDHRLALNDERFGMVADLQSATDAQVGEFERLTDGASGVASASTNVLALFSLASEASSAILENQRRFGEAEQDSAALAASNASSFLAATATAAAGVVKNQRVIAGIKGASEVAESFAQFAVPNPVGGVAHAAAAAKFFAVAVGGRGSSGGGAASAGGGGAASTASRAFGGSSQRGSALSQSADLRSRTAAPRSITQVFVNPVTGTAIINEVNANTQRGGSERFDQGAVSVSPLRMDP